MRRTCGQGRAAAQVTPVIITHQRYLTRPCAHTPMNSRPSLRPVFHPDNENTDLIKATRDAAIQVCAVTLLLLPNQRCVYLCAKVGTRPPALALIPFIYTFAYM
ncbi:hypothetical protein E2C01_005203 [Portunus trituberculatus]|uniref:Uncharacterized protein n=1 Tax=Portunus trituberculatus TaxID=210409 RepID=A0A5B7CUX1_PORTR|nr:hypothetical protein [Portunus trituberculatus]